ncbi:MAG: SprT family zinc-dependent metalloprotease, partial [Spirochaetota bacterium]
MTELQVKDIKVEVQQKDIKNVHLSVYPPNGRVKISAPLHYDLNTLKVFVIAKFNWIKKEQEKFQKQEREKTREFAEKESHYYRGQQYLLKLIEKKTKPKVEITAKEIIIYIRNKNDTEKIQEILHKWYRQELKEVIPTIIEKWERIIQVRVNDFGIKKMKTKWGTCNPDKRKIWLNLELAKKPMECLEYVVLHEMIHLLEKRHNERF